MKLGNLWKSSRSKAVKAALGTAIFAGTTVSSMAATTLGTLTGNVNHLVGDGLQMLSIAGVGIAIVFGFVAFNHLRQHAQDAQGNQKHMGKFFIHTIVALGFLSVPAILHMVENTAFNNTGTSSWSVPTDGNITANQQQ